MWKFLCVNFALPQLKDAPLAYHLFALLKPSIYDHIPPMTISHHVSLYTGTPHQHSSFPLPCRQLPPLLNSTPQPSPHLAPKSACKHPPSQSGQLRYTDHPPSAATQTLPTLRCLRSHIAHHRESRATAHGPASRHASRACVRPDSHPLRFGNKIQMWASFKLSETAVQASSR